MKIRLIVVAFLAPLTVLFLSLAPVSAHNPTPVSASPADGAILSQPPDQVTLTFAEEASEKDSFVQVFDGQGQQVDLGNGGVDLNDPDHQILVVRLPASLPQGVYLVKWQIGLADGDISQGQYYFGVGNVTLPANPPPAQPGAADPPAGQPIALWVGVGAAMAALAAAVVLSSRKTARKP